MSEETKVKMLVEGMKRLRVIEKRMAANSGDITRYSSMISTERPQFDTEEKQRKKVKSLAQANTDLMDEYLKLKKCIEFTNLMTQVEIKGTKYRISDLLVIKRKLAKMMQHTYLAMNTDDANRRMSVTRSPEGQTPSMFSKAGRERPLHR